MDNNTNSMPFFSDINIHEYADHPLNFDQIIEMLRGEVPTNVPIHNIGVDDNFDPHILSRNVLEDHGYSNQFCEVDSGDVFNNFNSPTVSATNNTLLNSFEDDMNIGEDEQEDDEDAIGEGEHSSATTNTNNTKKSKVDRSRTLISERRRRGRMKEKLYALRALVPNITKMDKASIVGDAVLYVQDLQMQAKKLKSQIEDLKSSYKAAERCQAFAAAPKKNASPHLIPLCNKLIMQMDVLQIESGEFYVKVVSNKGQGVAASLHRALDSLSNFMIQCSNLTSLSEQFVLSFTLNVGNSMNDLNLPSLKLWISGAFLKQGFELRTSQRVTHQ